MDGGMRSGQDVLKAVALGAMGEQGVTKALEIIHKELDLTMAFCGRTDIKAVDGGIFVPGAY